MDAPPLAINDVIREGNRRVARRRTAGVAVVGTLAVLAAVGSTAVLPRHSSTSNDAKEDGLAAAFAESQPTYSIGNTVYIDGHSFTVDHTLISFVQTTEGIVYSDADFNVWASDGGNETKVGTMDESYGSLVGDGSRAAWLNDGSPKHYVVYDQATDQSAQTPAEVSTRKERGEFFDVEALDGATLYSMDDRGVVRWDSLTGDLDVLAAPDQDQLEVSDVKNGTLAWSFQSSSQGEPKQEFRVGADLANGSPVVSDSNYVGIAKLSPNGDFLAAEVADGVPGLFDAHTGSAMAFDPSGYPFLVMYLWTGNDTIAAAGIKDYADGSDESTWVFDLLTCRVSTGTCEVAKPGFATMKDRFNLPVGAALDR
ncbi:MAG: hypothetical protein V9F00_12370 [Nocardioides sp.]